MCGQESYTYTIHTNIQTTRYLSVFKENVYSYCSLKPKIVCICIQQILHIVQSLQQEVKRLVIQRPNIQIFPGHSFLTSPSLVLCFVFCFFNGKTYERDREMGATLQRKSHLCIPFLGIARPQPQFPLSCVCERFIESQEQSTYFLQQNR
jgi:hypothetical protein